MWVQPRLGRTPLEDVMFGYLFLRFTPESINLDRDALEKMGLTPDLIKSSNLPHLKPAQNVSYEHHLILEPDGTLCANEKLELDLFSGEFRCFDQYRQLELIRVEARCWIYTDRPVTMSLGTWVEEDTAVCAFLDPDQNGNMRVRISVITKNLIQARALLMKVLEGKFQMGFVFNL